MRKKRPELKQAWDMSLADLERHSVWTSVHGADESEWWYEETDEATYRPWTGSLPVTPERRNLLVRATMVLHNGNCYDGVVEPVPLDWATASDTGWRIEGESALIARQQPKIFVENKSFFFWGGMPGGIVGGA
jgi:hypothetical protein